MPASTGQYGSQCGSITMRYSIIRCHVKVGGIKVDGIKVGPYGPIFIPPTFIPPTFTWLLIIHSPKNIIGLLILRKLHHCHEGVPAGRSLDLQWICKQYDKCATVGCVRQAAAGSSCAMEAYELLIKMMDPDHGKRPLRHDVTMHPFFLDDMATRQRIERMFEVLQKVTSCWIT